MVLQCNYEVGREPSATGTVMLPRIRISGYRIRILMELMHINIGPIYNNLAKHDDPYLAMFAAMSASSCGQLGGQLGGEFLRAALPLGWQPGRERRQHAALRLGGGDACRLADEHGLHPIHAHALHRRMKLLSSFT